MEMLAKKSQVQIEFTSDEVNALLHILKSYNGGNYDKFNSELIDLLE